jgi:hypothetical protein
MLTQLAPTMTCSVIRLDDDHDNERRQSDADDEMK